MMNLHLNATVIISLISLITMIIGGVICVCKMWYADSVVNLISNS